MYQIANHVPVIHAKMLVLAKKRPNHLVLFASVEVTLMVVLVMATRKDVMLMRVSMVDV